MGLMHKDLRDWLVEVEKLGQLKKVSGARWDLEMGALTQLAHEKYEDKTPALLFDDIPGYPQGYRTLYGHFSTVERIALTLGLPQGLGKVETVRAYQKKMANLKPVTPEYVKE